MQTTHPPRGLAIGRVSLPTTVRCPASIPAAGDKTSVLRWGAGADAGRRGDRPGHLQGEPARRAVAPRPRSRHRAALAAGRGEITRRSGIGKLLDRVMALPEVELVVMRGGPDRAVRSTTQALHVVAHPTCRDPGDISARRCNAQPGSQADARGYLHCRLRRQRSGLCNPSALPYPDQSGLTAGQIRVALASVASVRGTCLRLGSS